MLIKQKQTPQLGLFHGLSELLDQSHSLYILANTINWQLFEEQFEPLYCKNNEAPAKPIRLMVSLLILKYLRNLSDENLVEQWSENIYYQHFGGEHFFRPNLPCVPTELVAFRNRIGQAGMELILQESIRINTPKDGTDIGTTISVDTTVQEKNITYPTDDKLYKKIIVKCLAIAKKEAIKLRQTYAKELKALSFSQRFKKRKNGFAIAKKAAKRVKTIAGRLLRDIEQKLLPEMIVVYQQDMALYKRVLFKKYGDSNKIYSLHEPNVKCYAKGKEHKKFEFGSKASIAVCQQTGVIIGALNFTKTLNDSKTIPAVLEQYERINNKEARTVFADRGYKGIKVYKATNIHTPLPNKNITEQQRKSHCKRAAIEPVISHLKHDYRMGRNFLKGITGDAINIYWNYIDLKLKRAF